MPARYDLLSNGSTFFQMTAESGPDLSETGRIGKPRTAFWPDRGWLGGEPLEVFDPAARCIAKRGCMNCLHVDRVVTLPGKPRP
jgi:hypothetical protein